MGWLAAAITSCRCQSSAEYSAASSWRGCARRTPPGGSASPASPLIRQTADARFEQLVSAAVRTDWVVHAKRPFGGPDVVLKYLARYTHRVAISNSRLLDLEDGFVRFRYKDYAHGNRKRVMRLSASEFVRRLLLHVLPRGFVRIRHYGLWSNRQRREDLALCRRLLDGDAAPEAESLEPEKFSESLASVTPSPVMPKLWRGPHDRDRRIPAAIGRSRTDRGSRCLRGRGQFLTEREQR